MTHGLREDFLLSTNQTDTTETFRESKLKFLDVEKNEDGSHTHTHTHSLHEHPHLTRIHSVTEGQNIRPPRTGDMNRLIPEVTGGRQHVTSGDRPLQPRMNTHTV